MAVLDGKRGGSYRGSYRLVETGLMRPNKLVEIDFEKVTGEGISLNESIIGEATGVVDGDKVGEGVHTRGLYVPNRRGLGFHWRCEGE